MKLLQHLCAYELVDFKSETARKLKTLDSINKQLSSFSSAKAGSVEASFYGYSSEVIEEYRLIALISKGGHPASRVLNRMQMLAYYVNNFTNRTIMLQALLRDLAIRISLQMN